LIFLWPSLCGWSVNAPVVQYDRQIVSFR